MSRYITGAKGMKDSSAEDQAEVIRRALEYLDTEDKWLQGKVAEGDRRCIAGAVKEALNAVREETDRLAVTVNLAPNRRFRRIVLEDGHVFLEDWNDDPNRTFADVKAYLTELYEYYAGEKWDADTAYTARSAVGTTEGETDGDDVPVPVHAQPESTHEGELRETPVDV